MSRKLPELVGEVAAGGLQRRSLVDSLLLRASTRFRSLAPESLVLRHGEVPQHAALAG